MFIIKFLMQVMAVSLIATIIIYLLLRLVGEKDA